jgi:hypothetical protein
MMVRVRRKSKPPAQGDFNARFDRGVLTLPAVFGELVESTEVESAEDFLSVVQTYPKQVAAQLGWAETEVKVALRAFATKLSEECGFDYLAQLDARHPHRPLGARTSSGTRPTSSNPPPHRKLG